MSQGRDLSEFEDLYRVHGQRLWRAVFAFTGDRGLADDAVSEAFTQAIRRGEGIRDPLSWIWRVAFLVARAELAARTRENPRAEGPSAEPDLPIDLLRGLQSISPMQRAAILLHHYGGYSTAEIARMYGSSAGAVRVHLSVGRRRLRRILEEGEDD